MGYILPINQEQYIQYVNRTTSYKSNYMQLHHVNPTTLQTSVKSSHHARQLSKFTSPKTKNPNTEKVRAQITGIGSLFDESI